MVANAAQFQTVDPGSLFIAHLPGDLATLVLFSKTVVRCAYDGCWPGFPLFVMVCHDHGDEHDLGLTTSKGVDFGATNTPTYVPSETGIGFELEGVQLATLGVRD